MNTPNKPDVSVDSEVMGETPVFVGTRVPIQTLVDFLTAGDTIDDFIKSFPTVICEQVEEILCESDFYADIAIANQVMRDDADVLQRLANSSNAP